MFQTFLRGIFTMRYRERGSTNIHFLPGEKIQQWLRVCNEDISVVCLAMWVSGERGGGNNGQFVNHRLRHSQCCCCCRGGCCGCCGCWQIVTILPDIWMTVRGHRRPGRPVTADVEVGALLGIKHRYHAVRGRGGLSGLALVWNADMALMFIWLSITATWRAPDTWNVPRSARKSNKMLPFREYFLPIFRNILRVITRSWQLFIATLLSVWLTNVVSETRKCLTSLAVIWNAGD